MADAPRTCLCCSCLIAWDYQRTKYPDRCDWCAQHCDRTKPHTVLVPAGAAP